MIFTEGFHGIIDLEFGKVAGVIETNHSDILESRRAKVDDDQTSFAFMSLLLVLARISISLARPDPAQ